MTKRTDEGFTKSRFSADYTFLGTVIKYPTTIDRFRNYLRNLDWNIPSGLWGYLSVSLNMPQTRTLQMQQIDSLTSQIVNEVSGLEGVDVLELEPPLQRVVDTDALESLFSPSVDGSPREDIRLEFTYCGYRVTIERDGDVQLRVEERTSK